MHTNHKTIIDQVVTQARRSFIISLRHKIEGGAEPQSFFKLHQLPAFCQPAGTFNVVREHKREFFAVRPARPAFRRLTKAFIDGPGIFAN